MTMRPVSIKHAAIVCLVLLVLAQASCKSGESPHAATPTPGASPANAPLAVKVCRVRLADLPFEIQVVGNFNAVTEASISPRSGGIVTDVSVRIGRFVPSGALLIQLDPRDLQLQIEQDRADVVAEQARLGLNRVGQSLRDVRDAPSVRKARAILDNARLGWVRNQNLYRADLIAQSDLQASKKEYLSAQADYQAELHNVRTMTANVNLKMAALRINEQKLANTSVRAPFAGYVSARNVDVGDYIQPGGAAAGKEYLKLVTLDPIYCTLDIPELYVPRLAPGQPISVVTSSFPGREFKGTVANISPALDPTTRTFKVQARLHNAARLLKPGQYGMVSLRLGFLRNSRMVPQVAQLEGAGLTRIFIVDRKAVPTGHPAAKNLATARSLVIQRGQRQGQWVQVVGTESLAPTAEVIVDNTDKLYDGMPVEVRQILPDAPAPAPLP